MKTIVTLAALAALLVSGCDANNRSAPPEMAMQPTTTPSLFVDFPPNQARYLSDHITVHGRIEDAAPASLRITVEGGAGSVLATMSDDGTWIAEAVPLDNKPMTTLSVVAENDSEWREEREVGTLWRRLADPMPLNASGAFTEGNLFFAYTSGEIREYNSEGINLRQYMLQTAGLTSTIALFPLKATQELLVPISFSEGGCEIIAVDVKAQTQRQLYRFDWSKEDGFPGNCGSVRLGIAGERISLEDTVDKRLITINSQGDILTSKENTESLATSGQFLTTAASSEVGHFFRTVEAGVRSPVGVIELHTFDLTSGTSIDYFMGSVRDLFESRPPLVTAVGDKIFYNIDATPGLLTLNPTTEVFLTHSGYKANNLFEITELSASEAAQVEYFGQVSKVNLNSGESTALFDIDPFLFAPEIVFSDFSDSNIEVDRGILFYTTNVLLRRLPSAVTSMKPWKSLYAFDAETFTLRQVFSTSGPQTGRSLGPLAEIQNVNTSLEVSANPDAPTLTQVDHRSGENTNLHLEGLEWDSKSEFIVGLDGKHIVVTSREGIVEYSAETLKITRRFDLDPSGQLLDYFSVTARFPGADGVIYLATRQGNDIRKLNFDTGMIERVSTPATTQSLGDEIAQWTALTSWSVQDNAVFIAHPRDSRVWRVDLQTGDSEEVFTGDSSAHELPNEITSIRRLDARNALLAAGDVGIYYLDLRTSAALKIPLQLTQ